MIDVLKIPVPKDKLRAMPKEERALLIMLGYMANNITMLTKLVIFSSNKTHSGVEQLTASGQTQMLSRLVIGFLHEAWMLITKRYLKSPLGAKYSPLLDAEGKAAFENLKKSFGGSNILSKLRNSFIFHFTENDDVLDAAFEGTAKEATLDEDWFWLFSHSNLNSFYYLNDFIVMFAMMQAVGETDILKAQEKIMGEVKNVSGDMAQFIMALEVAIWKQHFGDEIIAQRVEQIANPAHWLDHSLPFYVDLENK